MKNGERTVDKSPVRVLIADTQRLFSGALAGALARKPAFHVSLVRPSDAREVPEAVELEQPDVVLLDHWLDTSDLIGRIVDTAPECKVIVMAGVYGADHIKQALSRGAAGFLPKTIGMNRLEDAVVQAHRGKRPVFAKELANMVAKMDERHREAEAFARRMEALSRRETQVLVLLGQGRLIQEIAAELGISRPTVTGHINRILKKTGARSQAEVLAMARVAGIIQT